MEMDAKIKKLTSTYANMKSRSKYRAINNGLCENCFEILDKDEFISWSLNESSFSKLIAEWEASGKPRSLCPSIDRIDPEKGYALDNIQWLTVSENSRKQTKKFIPKIKEKPNPKNSRKQENKLDQILSLRMTPYEKNFIKGLADMYAGGNLSLYLIHAAFNCDRKFITEDDIPESNRRIIKGKKKGSILPPNKA